MPQWVRRGVWLGLVVLTLVAGAVGSAGLRVAHDDRTPSRSIGRRSAGQLEHGHVFSPSGPGYVTYTYIGAALGTQYANGRVRDALVRAFAARASAVPGARYVLGETAVRNGGPFHGHRTHQNGLSADVFMPVRDERGARAQLPTWLWDLGGYGWDFDAQGVAKGFRIDFDELGAFLIEVDKQAAWESLAIERVIITPEFVPRLLESAHGRALGSLTAKLTRRPVWVRHDEHVHIDFVVER